MNCSVWAAHYNNFHVCVGHPWHGSITSARDGVSIIGVPEWDQLSQITSHIMKASLELNPENSVLLDILLKVDSYSILNSIKLIF